jgi:hypothetical protein
MKKPTYALISAALAAAVAIALGAPPAGAQSKGALKKTAWGEPDISGQFSEFTVAPLERPQELGEKEFFDSPAEAEAYAKRVLEDADQDDETQPGTPEDVHYDMGTFKLSQNEGKTSPNLRTSIITTPRNGRIPPLTAAAIARRDARAAVRKGKEFDGPEMRSLTERCIVWPSTLPPILPGGYNSNLQIFQSPGYVVIQGEMGDPRIIPTDGKPRSAELPQWNGTSVGHWEGATLVVETQGFNPLTAWRNASEHMHVTERITRKSDQQLEYSFLVTDPETWAEPWGGTYPLTDLGGVLFEYACTEGNYGMANILSGQRAAEREAAARGEEAKQPVAAPPRVAR